MSAARDYACGLCGEEFRSILPPGDVTCGECDGQLCPHCGTWFGYSGDVPPGTTRDLIVPWGEVRKGDLALSDGGLMLVDEIRVVQQSDQYPDFQVAYAGGRRAEDDGTVTGRQVYVSPNAATLTAVRRAASGAAAQ